MKTNSLVYAKTHSVTYVTDFILESIQSIIEDLELDYESFDEGYHTFERGIKVWLNSGHLEHVTLEIYNPFTNELIGRFDFTIRYDFGIGDSMFWADKKVIKTALRRAGINPKHAQWDIVLSTKPGSPPVSGWEPCRFRPTLKMENEELGLAVGHGDFAAKMNYWRLQ